MSTHAPEIDYASLANMASKPNGTALIAETAPELFPWIRFLPPESVPEFFVELVDTITSTEPLRDPTQVAVVIHAWQRTAEVYADPELLARLLRDDRGDFGPVPAPDESPHGH